MDDTKPWYASSGVWGGIIAVAAPVLGTLHYNVSAADQASLSVAIAAVGGAVGGIVAIVGRVTASKQIAGK